MDEALPVPPDARRRLVFRLGDGLYAIDAENVLEVIQTPPITRVPLGFPALSGIANLRGTPLPVVEVARLQDETCQRGAGRRVIVYEYGERLGLLVDDVLQFGEVEVDERHLAIDLDGLLRDELVARQKSRPPLRTSSAAVAPSGAAPAEPVLALLTFGVAGQTFGLPLASIHEVLAWPDDLKATAGERALGTMAFRDGSVPVFSLASLLALPDSGLQGGRIVVVDHDTDRIGLAVDRIEAIRRMPDSAIDPVPPLLAHSGESTAEIEAIGRIDGGRTLISILSTQTLFSADVVEQSRNNRVGDASMPDQAEDTAFERFLIFTLGEESYGLPIGAVEEVIRLPDSITPIPNTPSFVAGVINLRGKAVPLIDQRQRFEASNSARASRPRAIVVTVDQLRAGFIVDSASDVVAIPVAALSPAPDLAATRGGVVLDRIAHIDTAVETGGRMILLVDPRELLTRAERDIVTALTATAALAAVS